MRWHPETYLLQVDASGLATARQETGSTRPETGEGIISVDVIPTGRPGAVIRDSKEILDLAGPYTLEIDTGCEPTSTPVGLLDLRHLSYTAVLTHDGSTLEVVLTESGSESTAPAAGTGSAAGWILRVQRST